MKLYTECSWCKSGIKHEYFAKGDMNFCSTECLGEFLVENTDFSIEYLEDPEGIEADAMEKAMREGVM